MKEGGKDDHPLLSKSHSVSLPTLITEPLLNKRTNQRPSANTEGEGLANTEFMEKELSRKGTGMKKKKIYMSLPLYKQGISVRTKETNATGCF